MNIALSEKSIEELRDMQSGISRNLEEASSSRKLMLNAIDLQKRLNEVTAELEKRESNK